MRQHSLAAERRAGAVLLSESVQIGSRTDQIISFAVRYALSTMFYGGFAARQGGHFEYGSVINGYQSKGPQSGTPVFQLKTPSERELKMGFS